MPDDVAYLAPNRRGDVLSAAVVYFGTSVIGMSVAGFAAGNVVLTLVWIGVAILILRRHRALPRLMSGPSIAVAVGLSLIIMAVPAAAQDTREEQLAAQRAEKSKDLHPYVPDALERRIEVLKARVLGQPPVYLFVGSAFPGGWLAAGPGYRGRFAESGRFDVHGAWSLKNYKTADAALALPPFGGNRVRVEVRGNWLDAPKVAFYGVGNDSPRDGKTSFLYRTTTLGLSARIRALSVLAIGGGVDSLAIETGPGTSGTSIERRFAPDNTSGLEEDPTYVRSQVFAEVDWRESPGYTRRGGLYRLEWSDYHQTSTGVFNFRRLDAEVQQFLPILRENWVIALRALVSTTDATIGNAVPHFLMPDLGGSRALRGYPSWRFRDLNRMLLTGEYRWTAGEFLDMALFLDAGKVVSTRSDFDLTELKTAYGFGARFHTPAATPVRIEVARTLEGTSLVFSFNPSF
jgi:hypothetical protein